jgi:hypothetical protein
MPDKPRASLLRGRIAGLIERVGRIGFSGRAELTDVAVLDGRTLTAAAVLRGVRAKGCTDLLVVARREEGGRRVASVGMPVARDGHLALSVAVPLEGPGALDLRKGEWRLALEYRTSRGGQRPLPTTATLMPSGRRSPAAWNPRSPGTGRRYRPSVDAQGNLVVRVVRFPTHAEVERVQVADRRVHVSGRIVGAAKLARRAERADVRLVVVSVDGKQRRRFAAQVTGGVFTAAIGLRRLRFTQDTEWVVRLRVGNAKPLVVRRVLSDLRDPAALHRYPVARLRGRRRIATTYTDKGGLLLQGRTLPPRPGGQP